MGTRASTATTFIALLLCVGCGKRDDPNTVGAYIDQLFVGTPPAHLNAAAWKDTHEFYSRRHHAPAWTMDEQAARADDAIAVLGRAREHGLDPAE